MNTPDPATQPVRLEIANATAEDLIFMGGLVALFCDPARAADLAAFRRGRVLLHRCPRTGRCLTSADFGPN